jgi:hypothetical protein
VVGFNTTEEWSQDVSADVAQELRRRCDLQQRDIPFFLQDFVDRYEGRYRDIQLPLPIRWSERANLLCPGPCVLPSRSCWPMAAGWRRCARR